MVGKIGKQLVFYQSSLWKVGVTRLMGLATISDYRRLGPIHQVKNKHSPVLLQLSSNFENCPLASRSERRSDWAWIGLANDYVGQESRMSTVVTMRSYYSSSGLLILDQKTSISHEFWDPTFSKTCPAMAGQAGLPSTALYGTISNDAQWCAWCDYHIPVTVQVHSLHVHLTSPSRWGPKSSTLVDFYGFCMNWADHPEQNVVRPKVVKWMYHG